VRRGAAERPLLSIVEAAEWLESGHLATDAELITFIRWTDRIGSDRANAIGAKQASSHSPRFTAPLRLRMTARQLVSAAYA
jgi:hypothetical protein